MFVRDAAVVTLHLVFNFVGLRFCATKVDFESTRGPFGIPGADGEMRIDPDRQARSAATWDALDVSLSASFGRLVAKCRFPGGACTAPTAIGSMPLADVVCVMVLVGQVHNFVLFGDVVPRLMQLRGPELQELVRRTVLEYAPVGGSFFASKALAVARKVGVGAADWLRNGFVPKGR